MRRGPERVQRLLLYYWRKLLEEEEPSWSSRQDRIDEERRETSHLDIDELGDGFILG